MKGEINTVIIVVMLIFVCSCIETIEPNTDEFLPIVINCILTNDNCQSLQMHKLGNSDGNLRLPVNASSIKLIETDRLNNPLRTVSFKRKSDFEWTADFTPKYGSNYILSICLQNGDIIEGHTQFPADLKLRFNSKFLNDYQLNFVDEEQKKLLYDIQNNSQFHESPYIDYRLYSASIYEVKYMESWDEEGNRIKEKVYQNETDLPCILWIFPHMDSCAEEYSPYSDVIATDHSSADEMNLIGGTVSDIPWCNIPVRINDKHKHNDDWWMNNTVGSTWYSNCCYTNTAQWYRILCPDIPLHKDFVRINHPAKFTNGLKGDKLKNSYLFSDKSFIIVANHSDSYGLLYDGHYGYGQLSNTNEVHFVSEEYDNYLRDLYLLKKEKNNFILSAYDFKNIYTNIEGGVGIFGADNITWDVVSVTSFYDRASGTITLR